MSKKKNKDLTKRPPVPAQKTNRTTKVIQHQFSGPIPPPETLQQYDQVISGAAERILAMAEKDAKHQREIEKSAIQFASREVKRSVVRLSNWNVRIYYKYRRSCSWFRANGQHTWRCDCSRACNSICYWPYKATQMNNLKGGSF